MTGCRYPSNAIVWDYARAGCGLVVCVGLLLFTDLLPVVSYIVWGLGLLFAVFAWRTLLRQYTTIDADESGIRLRSGLHSAFDRELSWPDLQDLKMRYFSTKRDRSDGWMQIVIKGEGVRIQLDSNLDGFEEIAAQAAQAAQRCKLKLNPTTVANLKSMGLPAEEEGV